MQGSDVVHVLIGDKETRMKGGVAEGPALTVEQLIIVLVRLTLVDVRNNIQYNRKTDVGGVFMFNGDLDAHESDSNFKPWGVNFDLVWSWSLT